MFWYTSNANSYSGTDQVHLCQLPVLYDWFHTTVQFTAHRNLSMHLVLTDVNQQNLHTISITQHKTKKKQKKTFAFFYQKQVMFLFVILPSYLQTSWVDYLYTSCIFCMLTLCCLHGNACLPKITLQPNQSQKVFKQK